MKFTFLSLLLWCGCSTKSRSLRWFRQKKLTQVLCGITKGSRSSLSGRTIGLNFKRVFFKEVTRINKITHNGLGRDDRRQFFFRISMTSERKPMTAARKSSCNEYRHIHLHLMFTGSPWLKFYKAWFPWLPWFHIIFCWKPWWRTNESCPHLIVSRSLEKLFIWISFHIWMLEMRNIYIHLQFLKMIQIFHLSKLWQTSPELLGCRIEFSYHSTATMLDQANKVPESPSVSGWTSNFLFPHWLFFAYWVLSCFRIFSCLHLIKDFIQPGCRRKQAWILRSSALALSWSPALFSTIASSVWSHFVWGHIQNSKRCDLK